MLICIIPGISIALYTLQILFQLGVFVFFFQAEDGIRDGHVTGVQTCALPISLKGPLHGGANEQVMAMLMEIGEVDNAIPYVKEKLANKERIMGMGHRVYRTGDPRAKHLQKMSEQLTKLHGEEKWYDMSVLIENYIKEEKGLPANVDFYSASVYHSLGIDHDLFTPIFAVSRMSGWLAHILEQYANNRLIRPRAEYTGSNLRDFVPMDQRG